MVGWIDGSILVTYLIVMVFIGLYFSRKQDSSDIFFLGGRKLNALHVVSTTFSTVMGASLVFSTAALAYQHGISVLWIIIAGLIGYILFAFAAPTVKKISDKTDAITLPDIISDKTDVKTGIASSLVLIIIFGGIVAVNFLVAGNILNLVFGMPLWLATLAFGVLVIVYSVLGGFEAIVWTDIIQMVWMGAGVLLALLFAIEISGGFSSLTSLPEGYLSIWGMGPTLIIGFLISIPLWFFASQDIFQRVYASKNSETAKKSMLLVGVPLVVFGVLVVLTGVFARLLLPTIPADQALAQLAFQFLPVGLAGFVLASFMAVANSSADSQLITVTSNVMQDFYTQITDRNLSKEEVMKRNRITLVAVGVLALVLALSFPNITNLFLQISSWFGILGSVTVMALFWDGLTGHGAFTGITVGFGCAVLYSLFTGDFESAMLVGLFPAILLSIAVSMFNN